MLRLFKFNTVLATIACTCLAGNVLASEVNNCSNNLKSNDICPVAVNKKKVTTVRIPLENRSSNLYTEVSQPKEKDETLSLTRLQPSPDFDATQVILMLLGIAVVTVFLGQNFQETDSNSTQSDSFNQANSRLHKKLLTLVESPETAKRLFLNTQNKYPERSANWLLEKTIYDLKHDRRAY
ncbi:MAG: hypothetical protein KI793_23825 [Rivularia sp. (in: Bacteria)]|nr:hypothetical protein [Rivularia sp. MS3]